MLAWINGIMIQGTPEEIEHFRMMNAKTTTSTKYFDQIKDDVPEHVKNYKSSDGYTLTHETGCRAWF